MRVRFPFPKRDLAIFGTFCEQEDSDAPYNKRRNFKIVKKHLPNWTEAELRARYDELLAFLFKSINKMWNEHPTRFEYEAVWRTSHLMHYGTDEDERPWGGPMWACGDCNDILKVDVYRYFGVKKKVAKDEMFLEGGFKDAFALSDAAKVRNSKALLVTFKIKDAHGNASDKAKKLFLCSEASADGDEFFLVQDEEGFDLFGRMSDIALGAPEEVDHYGGRKFGLTMEDLGDEDFIAGTVIADVIEALLLDGIRVSTAAVLKRALTAKNVNIPRNTMSCSFHSALFAA